MVKDSYVSLDNAKLLKTKGFNETCRAYWGGFNNKPLYLCDCNSGKAFDYCNNRMLEKDYSDYEQTYIAAPTHQMAMMWIRENYDIHIVIDYSKPYNKYAFDIIEYKGFQDSFIYDTYEDACEAAIQYCLEKLI